MTARRPEPHALVAPYALDAVAGADKKRFERHLARCPDCAGELQELREATARLAAAAAAEPPGGLVARAIVSAARTPQLSPTAKGLNISHRTVPVGLGSPRSADRPMAPRRLAPRLALAVAVMALAGAAATGAVALRAEHQLTAAARRDHQITQVLNAPDVVMLTAKVTVGGTATVVMSHHDHCLVLTTAGLPPPPADRHYQIWLIGPSSQRPAGVLPAERSGMTSPVIITGLTAGDSLGLTVAVQSRSHRPSNLILMINLTA